MKRVFGIFSFIFVFIFIFIVFPDIVKADFDWTQCEKKTFVITAYYSPQHDQSFYYKENFKDEKILNGNWTHWASWKEVFNGMLAAPSTYNFWEKIYFSDLWVWEISDRWWAIVEAGNRWFKSDRIDIWMWYWELWLVKALDFWVQRKVGYYCSLADLEKFWGSSIKVGFDFAKVPVFKNFFDIALWKQSLVRGRKDIWTWTLQKYLVKLWYLNKNKQTGLFGAVTEKAVCDYQTKKLISYPGHVSCGVFWPHTRAVMKSDVEKKWLLPSNLWVSASIDLIHDQAINWDQSEQIAIDIKKSSVHFDKPFYRNSYDKKVIDLQNLLVALSYYEWDVDWVYDDDLIIAVHDFQLWEWILKGLPSEASVAGYVWPKTREKLNEKLKSVWDDYKRDNLAELLVSKDAVVPENSFQFYRPYVKWEGPNEEIRILQKLLKKLNLYSDEVHWKNNRQTIDSVYAFQLKYWILTKDSHYTLHGFLGPSTRKRLNEMLAY